MIEDGGKESHLAESLYRQVPDGCIDERNLYHLVFRPLLEVAQTAVCAETLLDLVAASREMNGRENPIIGMLVAGSHKGGKRIGIDPRVLIQQEYTVVVLTIGLMEAHIVGLAEA